MVMPMMPMLPMIPLPAWALMGISHSGDCSDDGQRNADAQGQRTRRTILTGVFTSPHGSRRWSAVPAAPAKPGEDALVGRCCSHRNLHDLPARADGTRTDGLEQGHCPFLFSRFLRTRKASENDSLGHSMLDCVVRPSVSAAVLAATSKGEHSRHRVIVASRRSLSNSDLSAVCLER